MKIAQVTPFYPPVTGGVENAVEQISLNLLKHGHQVDVFTSNNGLPVEEIRDEIKIRRFPTIMKIGTFASLWPGFISVLSRENYDIIHTHVYRHPHSTIVGIYSRIFGKKAILSTHGPFHPPIVWGKLAPAIRLYDILLGRTLTTFSKVLVLDEQEKSLLQRMHVPKENIEVLHNGIESNHLRRYDPTQFLAKHQIRKSYICYLGRLHPTKGLEFLLTSFAKIEGLDGQNRLIIAGTGDEKYLQSLDSLTTRLGIHDKVKFMGHVSESEKMFILEGCQGLVLPSRYEPYGIVLLEAMAHGKPVITTYPRGSNFVSENHSGFLVRYGDENLLANRMSQFFEQNSSTEHLGKNGYEIASQRIWEHVVKRLEQIYRETAG